jgi:hypothetical protein
MGVTMQKTGKIDYAKLLGFESVAKQISGCVDFQDETISAKLGAKVGVEVAPAEAARHMGKTEQKAAR